METDEPGGTMNVMEALTATAATGPGGDSSYGTRWRQHGASMEVLWRFYEGSMRSHGPPSVFRSLGFQMIPEC